jgi:hypothetical protein
MHKISSLEELCAEKAALLHAAKKKENYLADEVNEVGKRIRPLLTIFNSLNAKIPTNAMNTAITLMPLLVGVLKRKIPVGTMLGTLATEFLLTRLRAKIGAKISDIIGGKMQGKRHPNHGG